ncbi:MAG: type II toxin-antitoxin system VapC family toxin [Verrucomicrobia bacterium]|nr:type II toxin-antitoxin system VapC family toxin [Verrucomicrobiota bacterium]
MPFQPLSQIPNGSDVFLDANVLIYALNGQSKECYGLLERCSREEVTGICLFEVVNEATHRFMLAEALTKNLIAKPTSRELEKKPDVVKQLTDYWQQTQRILNLNLLLLSTDDSIVRGAQAERQGAGLLTNDSMIVSCMRNYGIGALATNDQGFGRVGNITVYRPADLP